MNKISINEEQNICELYLNGLSMDKIAIMYNVSKTPIIRILKKHNVESRDDSHKGRLYSIDESYFETIDTPNKAYILGLFYADGMNKEDSGLIKIELQERDKNIIYRINEELKSNYPIKKHELSKKNPNHQDTYCLQFVNRKISHDLAKLGVIQNKSLKLSFPTFLPKELVRDFIRGYLDGDGHIRWAKTRFITICSTPLFCSALEAFLSDELGIESRIHNTKNENTKVLHVFKIWQIKKLLTYLYEDSDLHIERKYNLFVEICKLDNSLTA